MRKYKKYGKTEQNNDQSINNSFSDSNNNNSNQNKNISNTHSECNPKKRNSLKKDENSIFLIFGEILAAAKDFFMICINYFVPDGIPYKIIVIFFIIEIIYQGIIIYLLQTISHLLKEFFYVWNNFIYSYIYITSSVQRYYILTCEGLLLSRYANIKIYIYKSFNWVLNILGAITILFNIYEMKELNFKIHGFVVQGFTDKIVNPNINYKDFIISEYVYIYIKKEDDLAAYKYCFEMEKYLKIKNIIQKSNPELFWDDDTKPNLYRACCFLNTNNESYFRTDSYNNFFLCENKEDIKTASNPCVSSIYRQKRFNAHLKIAVYECVILILWNLYNFIYLRIINKHFPDLNLDTEDFSENEKNKNSHNNKNQNKIITFKDINGKEINDNNNEEEEEEDDNEYDEEEDDIKKGENNQKETNVKEFKIRKISKRKMKNYKKKKKKRYKEETNKKNKNDYFDEDILNLDYFDNKFIEQEEEYLINNDQDEQEDEFMIINNELNNKKNKDNKSDYYTENEIDDNLENDIDDKQEEGEQRGGENEIDYFERISMRNSLKKKIFENIEKYQLLRRIWKSFFDKYFHRLKNKIMYLFIEINKNMKEKN